MTDPKTTKTLPKDVRTKALQAIARIESWNSAVHQARAMEALLDQPGLVEHALIDDPRWGQNNLGIDTLDTLEQEMRQHGWSPDQFYQALGCPRPAAIRQSDNILLWRGRGPR